MVIRMLSYLQLRLCTHQYQQDIRTYTTKIRKIEQYQSGFLEEQICRGISHIISYATARARTNDTAAHVCTNECMKLQIVEDGH